MEKLPHTAVHHTKAKALVRQANVAHQSNTLSM